MAVTSFDQPNNNPNYPANSTMVQEVIKHLPNEEAHQTEVAYVNFPSAHIARDHGDMLQLWRIQSPRFDCKLSPQEVRMHQEQRSYGSERSDDEVRVAVDVSDSEMVSPVIL